MSKIASKVAERWMGKIATRAFQIDGDPGLIFGEMSEAAQEAEFLHADDDRPHQVVALNDDEHGMFTAGEVVYTSKGAPE